MTQEQHDEVEAIIALTQEVQLRSGLLSIKSSNYFSLLSKDKQEELINNCIERTKTDKSLIDQMDNLRLNLYENIKRASQY